MDAGAGSELGEHSDMRNREEMFEKEVRISSMKFPVPFCPLLKDSFNTNTFLLKLMISAITFYSKGKRNSICSWIFLAVPFAPGQGPIPASGLICKGMFSNTSFQPLLCADANETVSVM